MQKGPSEPQKSVYSGIVFRCACGYSGNYDAIVTHLISRKSFPSCDPRPTPGRLDQDGEWRRITWREALWPLSPSEDSEERTDEQTALARFWSRDGSIYRCACGFAGLHMAFVQHRIGWKSRPACRGDSESEA